jgi:hypothetical protein
MMAARFARAHVRSPARLHSVACRAGATRSSSLRAQRSNPERHEQRRALLRCARNDDESKTKTTRSPRSSPQHPATACCDVRA